MNIIQESAIKHLSLKESVNAFGGRYEELADEVMDALSPIAVDKIPAFVGCFKSEPYDVEQIFPDFRKYDNEGYFGIRIELNSYNNSLDRAYEVCKAFGLDKTETLKDGNFIIYVPKDAPVMKKFADGFVPANEKNESCNEEKVETTPTDNENGEAKEVCPNCGKEVCECSENLNESIDDNSITEEEAEKIKGVFEKEKLIWDNFPEVLSDRIMNGEYEVEMDNSNPTYLSSLRDSLFDLCDKLNIGFDSFENGNGFYGRTYNFYHYEDDEDTEVDESCNEAVTDDTEIVEKPVDESTDIEDLPFEEELDEEMNESCDKVEEGLFGLPMEEEDLIESLNEDIATSPVNTLTPEEILDYVNNIPKAVGRTIPPRKFKLGYITDATNTIAAKYRGGRGSINKETGEPLPNIKLLKVSEYSSVYVEPYASATATKDAFKAAGKDIETDVLPRRGFHIAPNGIRGIFESDSGKGLAFGPLMDSNCKTKVKYFLSIDGGAFNEVSKADVAQYTPNPEAFMAPKDYTPADPAQATQRTQTFYLNGIYMIGNLGNSQF